MADFCTLGQVMHHVTTCCFTGCFPPNTTLFVSLPLFFCRLLAHLSGGGLFSLKKEWARETRHCSWSCNKATSSAPDFNHTPILGPKELHHRGLRPPWNSWNALNRHAKSNLVAFNQQVFDDDVNSRVLRKKARQ